VTDSAIYVGTVRHRRLAPVEHSFEHRIGMLYLDLDELPGVLERPPLWSARGPALGRVRRADFVGDPAVPLALAVRDEVERQTATRPEGPIRLLTMPRTFGHHFNPLSLFYCYDAAGARVEHVLAQVTNTPWRERHCYAIKPDGDSPMRATSAKAFHVSPFMPPDLTYTWQLMPPCARLGVHLVALMDRRPIFDATLSLRRHPIDRRHLAAMLARWPLPAARTLVLIYGHAVRLKLKGAPHFDHPTRRLVP
jgi:DUF1365 family protein